MHDVYIDFNISGYHNIRDVYITQYYKTHAMMMHICDTAMIYPLISPVLLCTMVLYTCTAEYCINVIRQCLFDSTLI